MRTWLQGAGIAALLLLGFGCSPTQQTGTQTGNVDTGKLVYADGTPAAGAAVTFITVDHNPLDQAVLKARAAACTTTTDQEGVYFADTLLPAGYYNVFGELDSLKSYLDSVYIPEDDTVMLPTDTLRPSGTVIGAVRKATGHPANTAKIALIGTEFYTEPQGAFGNFVLKNLAKGTYRVKVHMPENDFLPFEYRIMVEAGRIDTIANPFTLVSKSITAIHCSNRDVWVGTMDGLAQFNGSEWITYGFAEGLSHNYITCIATDSLGNTWVGTTRGLNRSDSTGWIKYGYMDGISNLHITALGVDTAGYVWAGNASGLNVYNGQAWILTDYIESLGSNRVTAMDIDPAGIWVATETGISLFANYEWITYTREHGLASNSITSVVVDSAGRAWVGTVNGLNMYDGTAWQTWTIEDGLTSNNVTCLAIDRSGLLWVGTQDGLNRYDGQEFLSFPLASANTSASITAMDVDAAGTVWVGTANGLTWFNGQEWVFLK